MDAMYANQMTVSIGQDEVVLHFSFIAPNYDEKGDVLENRPWRLKGQSY